MSTVHALRPHLQPKPGGRKRGLASSLGRFSRYAGALSIGLALISLNCGGSDEKDDARECCNCIGRHECWDFDKCPSTEHCVCGLLGGGCSTDPPCLAFDDACRSEVCSSNCARFF